jgi:hypothetical protein
MAIDQIQSSDLSFKVLVGEPKGIGPNSGAILVTVPVVVGMSAVLDVENGVAEASLAECRVRRLRLREPDQDPFINPYPIR